MKLGFNAIRGHSAALRRLRADLSSGRSAGTYLFAGPEGVGKRLTALTFAAALASGSQEAAPEASVAERIVRGDYPDVLLQQPDGKSYRIEQARQMHYYLSYGPYEGRRRVAVVERAEVMTVPAANALLKVLEEPPPHSNCILLTTRAEDMLRTVRSRTRTIHFGLVPTPDVEAILRDCCPEADEDAAMVSRMSRGRPGEAVRLLQDPERRRTRTELLDYLARLRTLEAVFSFGEYGQSLPDDAVESLLDGVEDWYRDLMLVKLRAADQLTYAEHKDALTSLAPHYRLRVLAQVPEVLTRARRALRAHVNRQLTLENLALDLVQLYRAHP